MFRLDRARGDIAEGIDGDRSVLEHVVICVEGDSAGFLLVLNRVECLMRIARWLSEKKTS